MSNDEPIQRKKIALHEKLAGNGCGGGACLAPITDHAVVRKASKSCALDVL